MRRLLIDTDIFIDFLRGNANAVKFFGELWSCGDITFSSVITEAELLSGKSCERLEVRQKTETLINTTNKVNVGSDIAKKAGEYRRKYRVNLQDALIAATASKTKAIVITRNSKHYEQIKEICIKSPY
ncbi:MAG: type II toxin-antitoxin system VapC family toxin [Methanocellales archaeon]|nr:type II toxin-antitoxin system VapC family toxin [Methanocellales archaeon]